MMPPLVGVAASTMPCVLVKRKRRPAVIAQDGSACASASCGRRRRFGCFGGCLQALGGKVGHSVQRYRHVVEALPLVVHHLHPRAHANGGEKGDDQYRYRAPQQRLGG